MRKLSYDPLWKRLIDLTMKKTELAERAGISRGIITRMEKGEVVTLNAVLKICDALDCDIQDVVSYESVQEASGLWSHCGVSGEGRYLPPYGEAHSAEAL